jgi:hypothetical protein
MEHSLVGCLESPTTFALTTLLSRRAIHTLYPESILPLTPLYPPSCQPRVHFIGFFSRIRCQPDAVKDSLRILSSFIRPHHMRMPKRFGRELFGNLGSFFHIRKEESW